MIYKIYFGALKYGFIKNQGILKQRNTKLPIKVIKFKSYQTNINP
jgi:hypothetical protein